MPTWTLRYPSVARLFSHIAFAIAPLAVLHLLAAVAGAQPIVNPTALEFTVSATHDAVDTTGQPLLTGYDIQFFLPGAPQPFQSEWIGKPVPDAAGQASVAFAGLSARPSPGLLAELRVAAVGPGGANASIRSDPFMFSGSSPLCTFPLSSASPSVDAGGGSIRVMVNAGGGCQWVATASAPWLHIEIGSGTGFGYIVAAAEPNVAATPRSATLSVNGQQFAVTQTGGVALSCGVDIAPSPQSLSAEAQPGSLTVTSPAGCNWTTSSTVRWITVTAATGTGSGWVSLNIDANQANEPRTGAVMVGGQTWQVTQAGARTADCSLELSPTSALLEASAGTGFLSVASASGCGWSASSAASWLTITATTGSGVGWVSYRFEANPLDVARTASVSVAGRPVEIMQAGVTAGAPEVCAVDVSPSSAFLAASGGGGVLTVTGAANCAWPVSSDQAWLTITAATGRGPGWVSYRFDEYPSGPPRIVTLRVGTTSVQLTQLGASEESCAVDLVAASFELDGAEGVDSLSVSAPAGCTWSASSSASWLAITATTGVGSGWASFRAEANQTGTDRTSIVTIGDRAIRMVQRPFR